MKTLAKVILLTVLLIGCDGAVSVPKGPAEELINAGDFQGAIKFYRDALEDDPEDPELLEGYYTTFARIEDAFMDRSRRLTSNGQIAQAEADLSRAILILPESTTLRAELGRVAGMVRSAKLYRDASVEARLGRMDRAMDLVERSLEDDPENEQALRLLQTLFETQRADDDLQPILLQTGAPVTVNFRNASFKDAALALGRAYGVNMIFDVDLQDREISLYADQVDFAQAFELLLRSNRSFYRRLGRNSVVIAGDTPGKRAEYEDYRVRKFFIRSGNTQTIADTLVATLGLEQVSVDDAENTITVRASAERILLADQLINMSDRTPAEVVMEVEVLEVNRTKSEQLGIDFGSQISVVPPSSLQLNDVFPVNDFVDELGTSALSLPTATLQFFKQDVDARTLASPRIRALDGQAAKIHIGDEVPLRSSEIVETTGQTRTSFEYREVGIRLDVVPEVRLNASVRVSVDLEVSSLGENLGTLQEPAFVIGTRNVSTQMLLENGETAIIGGLIRDEDRDAIREVPGLGRIPAIGRVFQQRDAEGSRTDIILTLTPRVVRPRDLPTLAETDIYAGTGTRVTTTNPNDFLAGPTAGNSPTIRLDISGRSDTPPPRPFAPSAQSSTSGSAASSSLEPVLTFGGTSFEAPVGGTVEIPVLASGFPDGASGRALVRFRTDLIAVEQINSPLNLPSTFDNERGVITFEITPQVGGVATREIARIVFRGRAPGLSYLIFGNALSAEGALGLPDNTALRNSRVLVR